MSEKKLNKVTEKLEEIKKMSKDELKEFIVKQTGRNTSMDFMGKACLFTSILFLILGVTLTVLTNPIGWWLLGFTALTTVFSVVCNKAKKVGAKSVDNCTAELSLRIKQETEEEFNMVKKLTDSHSTTRRINKNTKKRKNNTNNRKNTKKPKAKEGENITTNNV